MFQRKTTFVIGAGASEDLRFPIGWQLVKIIADKLRRADPYSLADQRLAEALVYAVDKSLPADTGRADRDTAIGHYFDAAAQMHEAVALAPSIDSYMDGLKSDGRIQMCGKLAIIRCLTEAEEQCVKHFEHKGAPKLDFLASTSYAKLFKLVRERVPTERLPDLFHNISVISFNYDRSLEHYLTHFVRVFYRATYDHAVQIVKTMRILHPYGTVGPWHDEDGHHEFGDRVDDPAKMLDLAKRIQTFTESSAHADTLREVVSESEVLVFLGFGYIAENLQLLGPHPNTRATARIYGTAFGISEPNRKAITAALRGFFSPSLVMLPDWLELATQKCAEFLDDYAMPITLGT